MRLVSFVAAGGPPQVGVVVDRAVVDAGELLHVDAGPDVVSLLSVDAEVVARLAEALVAPTVPMVPLDEVSLLPPVNRPPNIRDHITFEEHATRQFTRPVPEVWHRRPVHYFTNTSRLFGHEAPVPIPATERLDFELEIAIVIGRECADAGPAEALDSVLGFTILNDWSARDLQEDEMAYRLGPCKGKDFATSLGPWVVTLDELLPRLSGGTLDADCTVRVNGEVWASSNAAAQRHPWATILCHAAQDSRLVPGDVLASGTVGGCSVGEAIRKGYDARYLLPGDRVELTVEGIGSLANTVAPNPRSSPPLFRAPSVPPMPEPLPR